MKKPSLIRSLAVAVALTLTTVALPTPSAHALPRNPCQDYVNQARANQTLGKWWFDYGKVLMNLGFTSQAMDAFTNAEVFYGFAEAYVSEYNSQCR